MVTLPFPMNYYPSVCLHVPQTTDKYLVGVFIVPLYRDKTSSSTSCNHRILWKNSSVPKMRMCQITLLFLFIFLMPLSRYTSSTPLDGCYWKLHTILKFSVKKCDQDLLLIWWPKSQQMLQKGIVRKSVFLITSIWLEPKILVFKVLCQVSDVRKDRSYKTFKRLPKSSQTWLIRLGTGRGGNHNPTWPVATVAHYKEDISAH